MAWGLLQIIEFLAMLLFIAGFVFALYVGALLIWANDIVHRHCAADDEDGWP